MVAVITHRSVPPSSLSADADRADYARRLLGVIARFAAFCLRTAALMDQLSAIYRNRRDDLLQHTLTISKRMNKLSGQLSRYAQKPWGWRIT
ncbi:MAG: hypothetical protein AAGH42_07595 [Pseudomonadota bacterium]